MKVLLGERTDELISVNLITRYRRTSAPERELASAGCFSDMLEQARVRLTRLNDEIYSEIKRARPQVLRHVSHSSSSDQPTGLLLRRLASGRPTTAFTTRQSRALKHAATADAAPLQFIHRMRRPHDCRQALYRKNLHGQKQKSPLHKS